jgi:transketolase
MSGLVSMRKAYGEALVELGNVNQDIVVLSADVSNSDHSYMFAEAFPDRFINVGIAEQCLVDVAVGLAYSGKIPFVNTFAFLISTRALEMVRTHICYGEANVKLMGAYAGLSDSFDGPTHHSIVDISVMRSLPNMSVVVPSDPIALKKLLFQTAEWPGPVFFRLCRNEVPVLFDKQYEPRIGQAVLINSGSDVAIFGTGVALSRCMEATARLESEGIKATTVEVHTIKPLDSQTILQVARDTGAVVTVEEHNILGGLGGAVAELLSDAYPIPVKRVGIHDTFAESGPYPDLLDSYGLSVNNIVTAAKAAIELKKQNEAE